MFLGTIDNLGLGGATFLELLTLNEIWAGERLGIELAVPENRMKRRSISVSVPFGPGMEIWRSCRFQGGMFRALTDLPGMGRFLPCTVGGNHCRLRHVGWEQMWPWTHIQTQGDGLLSCIGALAGIVGYPHGSDADLLGGTRFVTERFPRWETSHMIFYDVGNSCILCVWMDWTLEALEAVSIERVLEELEVFGELVLEAVGREIVQIRRHLPGKVYVSMFVMVGFNLVPFQRMGMANTKATGAAPCFQHE